MCNKMQTPAGPSANAADTDETTQGRSRRKRARPSYLEAYDDGQVGTHLDVTLLCCMCLLQFHFRAGQSTACPGINSHQSVLRSECLPAGARNSLSGA